MTDETHGHDAPDWSSYSPPEPGKRRTEEQGRVRTPAEEAARRRRRRTVWIAAGCLASVAAAVGLGFAILAERHQLPEISYDHVVDPETYEQVLAALERTTGSTEVLEFQADVHQSGPSIQVTVPPNDAQPLSVTYQWEDGTLEHYFADPADPADVAFDLAEIPAATLNALEREARPRVDDGIAVAHVLVDFDEFDGVDVIEIELVDRDLDHHNTFADHDGNITGTDEWKNG